MHGERQLLDEGVELQMLVDVQTLEIAVVLWAVANSMPDQVEVSANISAQNTNFTTGWLYSVGQALESGGLTSTIDTQQREALTVINSKGSSLDGQDWRRHRDSVDFPESVYAN
jgi:hypothetical protein